MGARAHVLAHAEGKLLRLRLAFPDAIGKEGGSKHERIIRFVRSYTNPISPFWGEAEGAFPRSLRERVAGKAKSKARCGRDQVCLVSTGNPHGEGMCIHRQGDKACLVSTFPCALVAQQIVNCKLSNNQ